MLKPAFIFIDLVNDFFVDPPLATKRGSLAKATNHLAELARIAQCPLVWVRQEFEPDLSDAYLSMRETQTRITIRGTGGSELIPELVTKPHDIDLIKKRYSAFWNTGLDALLRKANCSHVVIGGVNTHACVRTSAVDAFQLDYRVILAVDTIASYDPEYHRESLRYLKQSIGQAMTNPEIHEAIRNS